MNNAVLFSSASDRWETPRAVKEALYAEFALNFDPCPLDGMVDGLAPLFCRWHGKRVWCNPPYGPSIRRWLERGFEAEIAVYLLPARTDTRWFHRLCLPHASEIRFLKGRLKFGGSLNGAPFPSMVVIFQGPPPRRAHRNGQIPRFTQLPLFSPQEPTP
jgi:hypothetical protein